MLPLRDNSDTLYREKHTAIPNEYALPRQAVSGAGLRAANKIDAFADTVGTVAGGLSWWGDGPCQFVHLYNLEPSNLKWSR
jgi:hypothetical protein